MLGSTVAVAALRAEIEERLRFAARVVGTDGALVAYHVDAVDTLWSAATAPQDLAARAAALAAFDADLQGNRAGFDYGQRVIYAHGGSGLFLIARGRAPSLAFALDDAFRTRTGGLHLSTAWVPVDPDGRADAVQAALDRLRRALELAVDAAEPPDLPWVFPGEGETEAAGAREGGPSFRAGGPSFAGGPALDAGARPGPQGLVVVGGSGLWRRAARLSRVADAAALFAVFSAQVNAAAQAAVAALVAAAEDAGRPFGGLTLACLGARRLYAWGPAAEALAFVPAFAEALEAEVEAAAWSFGLEEKLQAAYGETGATIALVLGPASVGLAGLARPAPALLRAAHRLRADDGVRAAVGLAVVGAGGRLLDGTPEAALTRAVSRWDGLEPDWRALHAVAARAQAAPPGARAFWAAAAPAREALAAADAAAQAEGEARLEVPLATPLASWVRARVAGDAPLRAWLAAEGDDPNGVLRALPEPGAVALAALLTEGGA